LCVFGIIFRSFIKEKLLYQHELNVLTIKQKMKYLIVHLQEIIFLSQRIKRKLRFATYKYWFKVRYGIPLMLSSLGHEMINISLFRDQHGLVQLNRKMYTRVFMHASEYIFRLTLRRKYIFMYLQTDTFGMY